MKSLCQFAIHPFIGRTIATVLTGLVLLTLFPMAAWAEQDAKELPASVRWVLNDVGRLIDQKNYDGAVNRLTEFQAKGGPAPQTAAGDDVHHHPMVYFALGNCRLYQERYAQAEAALAQAVRCQPDLTAAWLNLAKACYEQGKHAAAADHFREAYDRCAEKQPEHLYYSAAADLMAQNYKAAIDTFERLFERHAGQIQLSWKSHWVHALLADGQAKRALPHIEALIAGHTGEERVRWQEVLLYQYVQLKMTAKARGYARALTRQTPAEPRWWKMSAQLDLSDGAYADALAAMTIYGYLTPLSEEERKLWADLSLQLGIPGQAAPIYEKMLADADDAKGMKEMLKNLVTAYRRLGQPEAALAQLDRAPDLGKDPELLMLRADLLYEQKRYDEASAAYLRAAREDHSRAGNAWLMAGYAAWQANDIDTSRRAFTKAADFKPHRQRALLAMRQLQKIN